MSELAYGVRAVPVVRQERIEGLRLEWGLTLLWWWQTVGVYLDGWAHAHLDLQDNFFTPWHAVLYSGVTAAALLLGAVIVANHGRGYAWPQAVPAGQGLTLLGLGLFGLGGFLDMLWHIRFGVESNIEALVSPTHLLLVVSNTLVIGGILRAAWQRPAAQARALPAVHRLPIPLGLALVFNGLSIFSDYANPLNRTWIATNLRVPGVSPVGWPLEQGLALAGTLVYSALLVGLVGLALRRWPQYLPPGSMTLIISLNVIPNALIHDRWQATGPWPIIAAGVLAGLLADGLLIALRPTVQRVGPFRLFAFAVPTLLIALDFIAVPLSGAQGWGAVHLWAGTPILAGMAGLLVSFLIVPPVVPAEARLDEEPHPAV